MDHGQALGTKASERYLLGEMSEPERFDFEGHYFICEACAEEVRIGAALTLGIKAVGHADASSSQTQDQASSRQNGERGRRWFGWLTPLVLTPSAAALALAILAGYQGLVVIPGMRETVMAQAMEPVVLRSVARGEEPVIVIDRTTGLSVLAMDVNAGEPGQSIDYELLPPGAAAIQGSTKVPPAGTQLLLVVPNATLRHPGVGTLVLRTPQDAEVGRYPFRIQIK